MDAPSSEQWHTRIAQIQELYTQQHFGHVMPVLLVHRRYLRTPGHLRDVPLTLCIPTAPLNTDYVCVAVGDPDSEILPDIWGLHRIAPLLLMCGKSTLTIPLIRESDCKPWEYRDPGYLHHHEVLYKYAERSECNIDILNAEMDARMVQYEYPTDAGVAALTIRSFTIAAAAVHYAPPHVKRSLTARFLQGEKALARFRLGRANIAHNTSEADHFTVDSATKVGSMLLKLMHFQQADETTGLMPIRFAGDGNIICSSMALWCWKAMDQLSVDLLAATEMPRTALITHEGAKSVVNRFTTRMFNRHLATHKQPSNANNVVEAATAVPDLEDLAHIMPGCMRMMMNKMKHPTPASHYKRDQRRFVHNYVLANGVNPDSYRQFVLASNTGCSQAYAKKLSVEVAQVTSELSKDLRDWTGCKKAPCVFLVNGDYRKARVRCHDDFNRLAGHDKDPADLWFTSPLDFTQRLAKIHKDRKLLGGGMALSLPPAVALVTGNKHPRQTPSVVAPAACSAGTVTIHRRDLPLLHSPPVVVPADVPLGQAQPARYIPVNNTSAVLRPWVRKPPAHA